MKLRNKKTGEIEAVQHNVALLHFSSGKTSAYHSLAKLNDDWEDYEPQPLIKDEKIRNIVRAWAEVNWYDELLYNKDKDCLLSPFASITDEVSICISFGEFRVLDKLEDQKLYTIAELCGEEE